MGSNHLLSLSKTNYFTNDFAKGHHQQSRKRLKNEDS